MRRCKQHIGCPIIPEELLSPYEPVLLEALRLFNYEYGARLAVALGKIGSQQGRVAILQALGDGKRFDAWLFHKALEAADRAG